MPQAIPIAALALTAIGTGVSVYGAMEQGAAQQKQERAQSRLQSIRAARERTSQIREARIRRAEIIQAGANQGASESSSVASGAGNVRQQSFSNIQYINQQEGMGIAISKARQEQINAQGISTLGQGIAAVGGTVFNNREEIGSIFESTNSFARRTIASNPGIF